MEELSLRRSRRNCQTRGWQRWNMEHSKLGPGKKPGKKRPGKKSGRSLFAKTYNILMCFKNMVVTSEARPAASAKISTKDHIRAEAHRMATAVGKRQAVNSKGPTRPNPHAGGRDALWRK